MALLDPAKPEHAYAIGFLQGDGSHYRAHARPNDRRGKVSVEVGARDRRLLERLAAELPVTSHLSGRRRATNFAEDHETATLTIHDLSFRTELIGFGVPEGPKSRLIEPPATVGLSKVDYFRGLIDADGSLGLTGEGFPFLSLCTSSERMADAFKAFCLELTGRSNGAVRNQRDGAFNVMYTREAAQIIVAACYYPGALALDRKQDKASLVADWVWKPRSRDAWRPQEEDLLRRCTSVEEACSFLPHRTELAIKLRVRKLAVQLGAK